MELLLYFIDFDTLGYCLAGSFAVGINHIASLKRGDNDPGKVKFSDIKKLRLSDFFKKKSLKLMLFWLGLGGLLAVMIGIVKGMLQASVQVYSTEGVELSEWELVFLAVFFVLGLFMINYYFFPNFFPNQKELKDLRSRVAELEKTSPKTG